MRRTYGPAKPPRLRLKYPLRWCASRWWDAALGLGAWWREGRAG